MPTRLGEVSRAMKLFRPACRSSPRRRTPKDAMALDQGREAQEGRLTAEG